MLEGKKVERVREGGLKEGGKAEMPILGTEKVVDTLSIESMLRPRRAPSTF